MQDEMVADAGLRPAFEALLIEYVSRIDEDRLEDLIELFCEDASYRIIPRENVEQDLPLTLMLCENRRMLRDRIVSLREANIYNLHYDRHLLSCVRHLGEKDGIHHVEAAFAVYQTSTEGVTRLFSVGKYVDRIVRRGDRFLFADKTVVVDTAAVPTLLATPI